VLELGVDNSRDVTRLVTRASTRLARDLRPFAKVKFAVGKKKKALKTKRKKKAGKKSRRRSA